MPNSYGQDTINRPDSIRLNPTDTSRLVLDTAKLDSILGFRGDSLLNGSIPFDSTPSYLSEDAVTSKVDYVATDSLSFDIENQKVYLYGSAQINYENIELKADYIELKLDSNFVIAHGLPDSTGKIAGEPIFTEEGENPIRAQQIKYNFNTKKGVIWEVKMQEGDGYIHGSRVKKMPNDEMYIKNGKYTTCNLDDPHFYINTSKLKIIPDDKIIMGPANLVLEDVPTPLGLPFGFFPNKKDRTSGVIIPFPGDHATYGFFFQNGGYYWAISDQSSLTLAGDIYTNGSYSVRPTYDYKKRYRFSGGLNMRINEFRTSFKEDPDYQIAKNFLVEWKHQQDRYARPNSSFSANVQFGSSDVFRKDISSTSSDFLTNTMNSSISYNKRWPGSPFNLTLSANHAQNTKSHTVNVTLPELNFSMSRYYIVKKVFQQNRTGKNGMLDKLGIQYNLNSRNEINTIDSLIAFDQLGYLAKDFQNGIKHSIPISTSGKILTHFNLRPYFNYTNLMYFKTVRKSIGSTGILLTDTIQGFDASQQYNFGAEINWKRYGTMQFKRGRVQAIRHVMTPSVGFNYTPENNTGLESYIDTLGRLIEYSIYDNVGIYGKPSTKESGRITFGVLNNLEMKLKPKSDSADAESRKIKIIESLKLNGSYDLIADSMKLSDLKLTAFTNVAKGIRLNVNGTFSPYDFDTAYSISSDQEIVYTTSTYYWDARNKLAHLTNASVALSFELKSKQSSRSNNSSSPFMNRPMLSQPEKVNEEEIEYVANHPEEYIDFNIPWSLRVNYNLTYSRPGYKETIKQTLDFSGDISFTPKWKVTFRSGWDFQKKNISYTTLGIYRDLHCWDMKFDWIPFGTAKSYIFTIAVKSSLLQDLKYTKRSLRSIQEF